MFEDDTLSGEEEYKQKELKNEVDKIKKLKEEKEVFAQYFARQAKQLEDLQLERDSLSKEIKEVLEENAYLKQQNAELKSRNQEIEKEGDKYRLELVKSEERVKELKTELKRSEEASKKRFSEQDEEVRQLKQQISVLEQKLKDKDSEIASLKSQLADEKDKAQSTDKINEELRKKLEQSESELNRLRTENTTLKDDIKKMAGSTVKGDEEKQLAEQLMEAEKKNKKLTDEVSQLAEELNKLQKETSKKEIPQPNIGDKSLADEMGEVDKSKKIEKLREEIGKKDLKIEGLEINLKQLQEENEQLKQKATKNIGVDTSSLADQKETKGVKVQTDLEMKDSYDLYDIRGKRVKTKFLNPKSTLLMIQKNQGKAYL